MNNDPIFNGNFIQTSCSCQRLTVCVTCGWAGVDKTPRAGFCLGVENARKWRRIPPVKCTHEDEGIIFYERNRRALGQYTPKRQARKPNKAVESASCNSRGAPWFPVKLIYILAA